MKKSLFLFVTFVFIAGLTSCSGALYHEGVLDDIVPNDGASEDVKDPDPDESIDDQPQEEEQGIKIDMEKVRRLVQRLVVVQNDNGSYGWQHNMSDPVDTTGAGYQNVTGVTILGFFDLFQIEEETEWAQTVQDVRIYMEGKLDDFLTDPFDISKNLSCPNWTFFVDYLAWNPDATLQTKVITGFNELLTARDIAFGDDPSVMIDGMFNRRIVGRASIPGILPWDLALCAEAAEKMSVIDTSFEVHAIDAFASLADYINTEFFPAYDADTSYAYADISVVLPIYLYAKYDPENYAVLISELKSRLEPLITSEGSVTNGSDNDGPAQATAYALMAMKIIEHERTQDVQDYLESLIDDATGAIWNPDDNIETFEVEGEVLKALISR